MTLEQTKLAKARLRLGITNVGVWVLAACAGLVWPPKVGSGFGAVALIYMLAILVQAGFDFLGGAVLMPVPRPSYGIFARRWIRGIAGQTLVLFCVAVLHWGSFVLTGGFCLAVFLSSIGLVIARTSLLRIIGGAEITSSVYGCEDALIVKTSDPAFTGGVLAFGREPRSLLPDRWLRDLPEDVMKVESARRRWQIKHGLAWREFWFVVIWNLLGASVGNIAFDFGARPPAAAIFGHACWMTIWAFISLLILPSLSRGAVLAADHAVVATGGDPREWISLFPSLVAEDGSANTIARTIFYPAPSCAMRLQRLGQPPPQLVPGNVSRCYLYYSWSTLTLLGRAVHCNVGRPALWVFPPTA